MLPSHVQLYRGDFPYGFYFVSLHGNLCAVVWVRGKQVNIKMPLPVASYGSCGEGSHVSKQGYTSPLGGSLD